MLRNRLTECLALVGNKCVKPFIPHISLDAPTYAIFASIKRVRKDPDRAVHKHLLKLAKEKKRITAWAESWYANHSRKRVLSTRQISYRRCLNHRRILSGAPPANRRVADRSLPEKLRSDSACLVLGPGRWTINS